MKDIETLPKLYIRGQIAPKGSFMESAMPGETFSASDLVNFLQSHKEDPAIVVEISSNGGFRSEGVEIYSLLKNCGKEVITIGYKVNSIATVIMLGGSTRLVAENAEFGVHFARIDPRLLGSEALTADDLQQLAEETERADKQIVDIYCSELGEDKRMELLAAMAEEVDLGARGAVKLGFATGYYKKKKKVSNTVEDFCGFALTDGIAQLIENNMAKTEIQTLSEKIENRFKSLVRILAGIKNELTFTLQGGGSIYVVPADPAKPEELKDAKVYTVDEAGIPTTEAPADGELTLDDGRVIVVAGGVVTEVRDVEDTEKLKTDLAAKDTEIEALKAQLNSKEEEISALKGTQTQMSTEVDAIKNEFAEFKKKVPGDRHESGNNEDTESKVDLTKMSRAELFRHNRMEQIKMEKRQKV